MTYDVEIFDIDSGEVVRTMPCKTKRTAEKVEAGAQINLSTDYDTRIIERGEGE